MRIHTHRRTHAHTHAHTHTHPHTPTHTLSHTHTYPLTLTLTPSHTHPHSSHLLKVALERKDCALREVEGERDELAAHYQQLETEVLSLRKASEEARHTRSLALEERAKVRVGVSI